MKKILTILGIGGMLLAAQSTRGQQEVATTGDPPQVRVRIPLSTDLQLRSEYPDPSGIDSKTNTTVQVGRQGESLQKAVRYLEHAVKSVENTIDNPEFVVRIPEIFRENIRGDSVDLIIEEAALEKYQSHFPGLRFLKAAPVFDNSDMAGTMAEALAFQKYPTYEQYDSMMHYFADTYPSICRIDTFGTSVEGRLLLALKISDHVEKEEDEPAFLYTSTMHGDELVGYVLCLRLADFLLSNYGSDVEVDRIINDVELWINPISNPDGAYYPDNNSTVQESRRRNANLVDLNRDYPDPGTGEADDTSGRQPETQHMMVFMKKIRPNLSANFHSGAEVVNYPWDHKTARHPDNDWYILISREYADEAKAVNSNYMNLYASGITNGADWYIIQGGRQDYVNYYLQGREVTLELSYEYRLESEYLEDHWNYNKWSLINLVTQARYGIHGNVTDGSGNPLRAVVRVLDHDNDSSMVESDPVSGNFYRYLKEGVYDLVISSEGYVPDTLFDVEVLDYQKTPVNVQLLSEKTSNRSRVDATTMVVYPNPAEDLLRIRASSAFENGTTITITDMSGRMMIRAKPPAGTSGFVMDVSALHGGVYLLQRSGDNHPGSVIISIR